MVSAEPKNDALSGPDIPDWSESSGPLILVIDLAGGIVMLDSAGESTLGADACDLVGRPFWEACLAPLEASTVRAAFENQEWGALGACNLLDWRTADNGVQRLATRFSVVFDAEGTPRQVVVTATPEGSYRASQAPEMLGYRLASHEFRSRLHAVLFSIGVLERYGSEWSGERRNKQVGRIKRAAQQMTLLIEDMIEFERAASGELQPKISVLPIDPYCQRVVEDLRQLDSAGHHLSYSCADTDLKARMDERLLRHVLTNLLTNAFKYSPAGTTVDLAVCGENGDVHISVTDNGDGLSNDEMTRIFEAFYRGPNSANTSGLGLGLSLVKKLVEVQDGQIHVESAPGGGTRFSVRLPAGQ